MCHETWSWYVSFLLSLRHGFTGNCVSISERVQSILVSTFVLMYPWIELEIFSFLNCHANVSLMRAEWMCRSWNNTKVIVIIKLIIMTV